VPSGHFWQHRYDDLLEPSFAEEQGLKYPWKDKLPVAFGRFTAAKEPLGNRDVYDRCGCAWRRPPHRALFEWRRTQLTLTLTRTTHRCNQALRTTTQPPHS
jgi:hypothetical protein